MHRADLAFNCPRIGCIHKTPTSTECPQIHDYVRWHIYAPCAALCYMCMSIRHFAKDSLRVVWCCMMKRMFGTVPRSEPNVIQPLTIIDSTGFLGAEGALRGLESTWQFGASLRWLSHCFTCWITLSSAKLLKIHERLWKHQVAETLRSADAWKRQKGFSQSIGRRHRNSSWQFQQIGETKMLTMSEHAIEQAGQIRTDWDGLSRNVEQTWATNWIVWSCFCGCSVMILVPWLWTSLLEFTESTTLKAVSVLFLLIGVRT